MCGDGDECGISVNIRPPATSPITVNGYSSFWADEIPAFYTTFANAGSAIANLTTADREAINTIYNNAVWARQNYNTMSQTTLQVGTNLLNGLSTAESSGLKGNVNSTSSNGFTLRADLMPSGVTAIQLLSSNYGSALIYLTPETIAKVKASNPDDWMLVSIKTYLNSTVDYVAGPEVKAMRDSELAIALENYSSMGRVPSSSTPFDAATYQYVSPLDDLLYRKFDPKSGNSGSNQVSGIDVDITAFGIMNTYDPKSTLEFSSISGTSGVTPISALSSDKTITTTYTFSLPLAYTGAGVENLNFGKRWMVISQGIANTCNTTKTCSSQQNGYPCDVLNETCIADNELVPTTQGNICMGTELRCVSIPVPPAGTATTQKWVKAGGAWSVSCFDPNCPEPDPTKFSCSTAGQKCNLHKIFAPSTLGGSTCTADQFICTGVVGGGTPVSSAPVYNWSNATSVTGTTYCSASSACPTPGTVCPVSTAPTYCGATFASATSGCSAKKFTCNLVSGTPTQTGPVWTYQSNVMGTSYCSGGAGFCPSGSCSTVGQESYCNVTMGSASVGCYADLYKCK